MKTYKIGTTEINEYDINNLNHDYIKFKFDELLEALNEKKEEIYWTKCGCVYYNGIITKCALHLKEEPKPECEKCLEFKKSGRIEMHCHCWNFAKVGGTDVEICVDCYKRKDYKEPKSTLREIKVDKGTFDNMPNYKIHLPDCACGNHTKSNLREEIWDIIDRDTQNWDFRSPHNITTRTEHTRKTTTKIISLFKDTLLKEIKEIEMPEYQDDGAEHAHAGYVKALEDIINKIKNI